VEAKCPGKRASHVFALSKAVLASDLLGGEMAGLYHQPSGLYAQWLITLAGGSFGFVSKKID
jgi:hypothetical protein